MKNQNYRTRQGVQQRVSVSWAVAGIVAASLSALSPRALAQTQTDQANKSDVPELQEIVVSGIRASLDEAMKIKENASQVVDSITAEDIGKFPDSDVAESLARLSGVAMDRDETGRGNEVTIRGFGPSFNVVLIDGRQIPTQTNGREFNFDVMPSDAITRADVYKTSESWQTDGAIGGLIDMHTSKPFDFDGLKAIGKLEGQTDSLTKNYTPNAFLLLSDLFADRTFGALVSLSSQQQDSRTNEISTPAWVNTPLSGAVNAPSALMPDTLDVSSTEYVTKRISANAALQWRPADNLTVTLDGLYQRYEEDAWGTELGTYFQGNPFSDVTVRPDGVVESFTSDSHADLIRNDQGGQLSPQYLRSIGLNFDGKIFNDKLHWTLDASDSSNIADSYMDPTVFTVAGFKMPVTYIDNNGVGLPSVVTPPGLTDSGQPYAHYISISATYNDSKIRQVHSDETWTAPDNWGPLNEVRFGGFYQSEDYLTYTSTEASSAQCAYCGYGAAVPSSLFSPFNFGSGSSFGGYQSVFPGSGLSYSPAAYLAFLSSPAAFAEEDAVKGLAPGSTQQAVLGSGGYVPQSPSQNLAQWADVTEKTYAFYVQGNFKGDVLDLPWSGNLGVRVMHTQDTASGYTESLQDLTPIQDDPTAYNATYADNGQVIRASGSHSYTYALPSMNFRLSLPNRFVLRVAASKSVARPEPSALSPVISWGSFTPGGLTASGGNPNLKPYSSENFDLGLEWYYSPGGYLAAEGFRKNLTNFIEYLESPLSVPIANSAHLAAFPNNVATFEFDGPTNIGSAHVQGVELDALHMFSYLPAPFDGLGVSANATIMSTNAGLNQASPNATSTQTFGLTGLGNYQNVTLIYEKYGVGMRLAYNHRNNYLLSIGNAVDPLSRNYVKGYGELDAQLSYQITHNIIVTLSGVNLTNAVLQTYDDRTDEFLSLSEFGRRYSLSLRAAF